MIQEKYSCLRNDFAIPLAAIGFIGEIPALVLIFTGNYIVGTAILFVGLFLIKLALSWFFSLECYYEFDPEVGVVNQVIKEKKNTSTKQIATSSDIETFAVAGTRSWARHGNWWTYQVVMILKDGKVFPITSSLGKKHHKVKNKADELAKAMDCPCFDSVHEQALEIKKFPGHIEVSNRPWKFSDTLKRPELLPAILFFIALTATIVGIAICLP